MRDSHLAVADTSGTVPAGGAIMGQSAIHVASTSTVNLCSGLVGPSYASTHVDSRAVPRTGRTWPAGTVAGKIANCVQPFFASSPATTHGNQISEPDSPLSDSRENGNPVVADAGTFASGTEVPVDTLSIGEGEIAGSVSGDVVDKAILRFLESDDLTFKRKLAAILSVEPGQTR